MLATLNVTPITAHFLSRLDQPVPQPLMIAFSMIMADVGADRPAQHVLTKENHPIQALFAALGKN